MEVEKLKKKAEKLLYTVWSLVTVRNQLPAQAVDAKLNIVLSSIR